MSGSKPVDSEQFAAIRAFLLEFFVAMRNWEIECANLSRRIQSGDLDPLAAKEIGVSKLLEIFARFCKLTKSPHRMRGGGYNYSDPPEYGMEAEEVVSITRERGKFKVTTQQLEGFKLRIVYTLVDDESGYRLLDNRKFVGHDGKLFPCDL